MATRGPIPHTCPDINEQQRRNNAVVKDIDYLMRQGVDEDNMSDAASLLDDSRIRLSDVNESLEELRASNDSLRIWGASQEDSLYTLIAEIDRIASSLSEDQEELMYRLQEAITKAG